ncbi:MAG: hypothetical protein K2W95_20060 [Candidatus Obscuribacterales bacterium]|nr:hypothetical protein [Candidatus Obscuribacterales bacterium]
MSDENQQFEQTLLETMAGDKEFVAKIRAVRQFAYDAFDKLDGDKNGYLDREELIGALVSDKTSHADREFISFLLNNQEQIASAYEEGDPTNTRQGISRAALDSYFRIILNLF